MEAYSFLETLAGVARHSVPDRAVKFATIDPAYDPASYPGTLPKVTFDGESALTVKRYASTYAPAPGDRVVMIPAGTTYLIVGKVGGSGGSGGSGAGAWSAITFDNGTSAAAGAGTPQSRMDSADVVRLSGAISVPAGLAGTLSIGTLAVAHRPSVARLVPVRSGAGGNVATELTIGTDGTLKPLASLGTSATRVGLDHITFVK